MSLTVWEHTAEWNGRSLVRLGSGGWTVRPAQSGAVDPACAGGSVNRGRRMCGQRDSSRCAVHQDGASLDEFAVREFTGGVAEDLRRGCVDVQVEGIRYPRTVDRGAVKDARRSVCGS